MIRERNAAQPPRWRFLRWRREGRTAWLVRTLARMRRLDLPERVTASAP